MLDTDYTLIGPVRCHSLHLPDLQGFEIAKSNICCCMTKNEALGYSVFGGCRTPFLRGGERRLRGALTAVLTADGGGATSDLCFAAWLGAGARHRRLAKARGTRVD